MTDQKDTPTEEGLPTVNGSRAEIIDPNVDTPQDTPADEDSREAGRKYAGRYDTVEDLEAGYKELSAEYTRQRQAATAQQPTATPADYETADDSTTELDPDIRAQIDPYLRAATEPLQAQLAEQQQRTFWGEMKAEYGDDIDTKVAEYFNTLSPDDQQQLDTLAGARMIAKVVGAKAPRKSPNTSQPTGGARTHNERSSTLTRAKIDAMSPDEYARRQPEIMAFYAGSAK